MTWRRWVALRDCLCGGDTNAAALSRCVHSRLPRNSPRRLQQRCSLCLEQRRARSLALTNPFTLPTASSMVVPFTSKVPVLPPASLDTSSVLNRGTWRRAERNFQTLPWSVRTNSALCPECEFHERKMRRTLDYRPKWALTFNREQATLPVRTVSSSLEF